MNNKIEITMEDVAFLIDESDLVCVDDTCYRVLSSVPRDVSDNMIDLEYETDDGLTHRAYIPWDNEKKPVIIGNRIIVTHDNYTKTVLDIYLNMDLYETLNIY